MGVHVQEKDTDQRSAHRTAWHPEGIRQRTVELADDFIYPFFPAGIAVSPSPYG